MKSLLAALAAAALAGAIQVHQDEIAWTNAPATLPAGTKSAVLEGDPKKPGIFTMRLKVPAGARIAPHRHPEHERVTVLSGSVLVGFGEAFREEGAVRFKAGDFYVNPPQVPHFVWTDEEAVLQITGKGPWKLLPVDPK